MEENVKKVLVTQAKLEKYMDYVLATEKSLEVVISALEGIKESLTQAIIDFDTFSIDLTTGQMEECEGPGEFGE